MLSLTEGTRLRIAPAILIAAIFCGGAQRLSANAIFFSGNLRTDANVTSCGSSCTLGGSNTDADYAQFAAVVYSFAVYSTTPMEAITYGYGGGTSVTGAVVPAGGLEPYLSLFDATGNFLASAYFDGTTCPPGANSVGGNCFDVSLDWGPLTPGVYQIALSAWENQSIAENNGSGNLSDGFTGLGNLGAGENLNYAFDVILSQNVPEPGPAAGLIAGGLCLILRKRMKRPRR